MSRFDAIWLGMARFLMRHTPSNAKAMLALATKCVSRSHTAAALSLMEAYAKLTPEAYAEPAGLRRHLEARLAGEGRGTSTQFVLYLGWLLVLEGRLADAGRVVDASLRLDAEDRTDAPRLVASIRERLQGLSPDMEAMAIHGYVNLLFLTGRGNEGIAIVEAYLGISRSATEEEFRGAVRKRFESLHPEVALVMAGGIAYALEFAGRNQEAAWLFEALGATAGLALDSPGMAPSLHRLLASMTRNSAASFLSAFSSTNPFNDPKARLAVLEQHLDLQPDDYRDIGHLAAKLGSALADVLPGTASNYRLNLANALAKQGRSRDALAIFRADLGLATIGMTEQAAAIGAATRSRLEAQLPKDMALLYVSRVGDLLVDTGEAAQAVSLLDGYLGFREQDRTSLSVMTGLLKALLAEQSEAAAASSLCTYLHGLLALDQNEQVGLVAQAFVDACGGLQGRQGGSEQSMPPLLEIYQIWLDCFQHTERRSLDVCRELITYLRSNFASQGTQIEDRADFIEASSELRRRILETGIFWADREADPEVASRIATEVQLWDAELSQRLLVEKFLLEPLQFVPPGARPVRSWAWNEEEPTEEETHLPNPILAGHTVGCLDESGGGPRPSLEAASPLSTRQEQDRSALLERCRLMIERGVDDANLAELLGERALLLRGSFREDGRLHWLALRSEGGRICAVDRWSGSPGDLARLRWAAARHDFRMALARFRARTRLPGPQITTLREVRQALDELLFELGPPASSLDSRLDWISSRFVSPWIWDTSRLLRPVVVAMRAAPDGGDEFRRWARDAAAQLRDLRGRLAVAPSRSPQEELDRITGDYIDEANQVLLLDRLAPALSPDSDLIVQLDDTLHTVPIAHLPVAGEPLFRRVRSIRGSITLLVTALQLETEREAFHAAPAAERLLSVSHFVADDKARTGALWLQHGFSVLARRYGLEAYGAADTPAGSVGLLRPALDDLDRLRVVAICGHGSLNRSGINLQQDGESQGSLWHGDGCDLSGVEWLWLVSCSIGRIEQTGDLDVEGFCVRLALHRARSIAAFRWPVHSVQAVALVNEAVRLYLEALQGGKEADARCLRARALNDARKSFFGDGVHPPLYPHVGLNTAAACEIFGLG